MRQEVGAAVITSNATQGPSDLIRQLNLDRAQGLVVLHAAVGDKQVTGMCLAQGFLQDFFVRACNFEKIPNIL